MPNFPSPHVFYDVEGDERRLQTSTFVLSRVSRRKKSERWPECLPKSTMKSALPRIPIVAVNSVREKIQRDLRLSGHFLTKKCRFSMGINFLWVGSGQKRYLMVKYQDLFTVVRFHGKTSSY